MNVIKNIARFVTCSVLDQRILRKYHYHKQKIVQPKSLSIKQAKKYINKIKMTGSGKGPSTSPSSGLKNCFVYP